LTVTVEIFQNVKKVKSQDLGSISNTASMDPNICGTRCLMATHLGVEREDFDFRGNVNKLNVAKEMSCRELIHPTFNIWP
jgi:hypothetical protein